MVLSLSFLTSSASHCMAFTSSSLSSLHHTPPHTHTYYTYTHRDSHTHIYTLTHYTHTDSLLNKVVDVDWERGGVRIDTLSLLEDNLLYQSINQVPVLSIEWVVNCMSVCVCVCVCV